MPHSRSSKKAKDVRSDKDEPPAASPCPAPKRGWGVFGGLLLALMAVTLIVHWPVLSARSYTFDDTRYVLENPLVLQPSAASAGRVLTEVLEPSYIMGYYQPLTMLSLMLDSALGGSDDNFYPYRRTNLILHVLNTALVATVLFLLLRNAIVAVLAAVIFGVHPMNIESVAWLAERKTLLATFFALFSLVLYVHAVGGKRLVPLLFAIVCFALSLLAKPITLALPLVLIVLDAWPLQRLNPRTLIEKIPFLAVAFVSGLITWLSQARVGGLEVTSLSQASSVLVFLYDAAFYLYKFLIPVAITSYYPSPEPFTFDNVAVLIFALLTVAAGVGAALLWRRTRVPAVAGAIYALALLPTCVISVTFVVAANRYAYFPQIGILLLIAWALQNAWQRSDGTSRSTSSRAGGTAAVLLLALLAAVASRSLYRHWQTTETLHRYMLRHAPQAGPVHLTLASALMADGRAQEAVPHLETATRSDFSSTAALAHLSLGRMAFNAQQWDRAIQHFTAATKNSAAAALAYEGLGNVAQRRGLMQAAINAYKQAVTLDPTCAPALAGWGTLLAKQRNSDAALEKLEAALRHHPGLDAAYRGLGMLAEADHRPDLCRRILPHFEARVRRRPNEASAHDQLAAIYAILGDAQRAAAHFQRAIELGTPNPYTHCDLARMLLRLQQTNQAIQHALAAIRLEQRFVPAYRVLGRALIAERRFDEAIQAGEQGLQLVPDDPELQAIVEEARQASGG